MRTMQYESSAMFSDYVDVDPTLAVDQFRSPDVMHIPPAVRLVLLTVIVKGDHRLVVTHVEECLAQPVADPDLSARCRQPVVDEDQPYSCYLG